LTCIRKHEAASYQGPCTPYLCRRCLIYKEAFAERGSQQVHLSLRALSASAFSTSHIPSYILHCYTLMAKTHIIGVFGPPRVGKTTLTLRSCGFNPFDLSVRIQSHTTTKGETHYFVYSTNLQSKIRIARASKLMEISAP
jgi:hypothetical protein